MVFSNTSLNNREVEGKLATPMLIAPSLNYMFGRNTMNPTSSVCYLYKSLKENKLKLYIKYMVSLRCKLLVKAELENLGLHYTAVDLGMVEIDDPITHDMRNTLRVNLLKSGLELMEDTKAILIDKIKTVIIEMIHYADELPTNNYSEYISKKLNYNYNYLSNIFSEVKGITIQQFIIMHKIEKVKELLLYDELNLTEISYKLQYSSVAHLSNQFKKVTGLSPSFFKKLKQKREINLEKLDDDPT